MYLDRYQPYLITLQLSLQQWGLQFLAVIFAPAALDHRSVLYVYIKYLPCSEAVWDFTVAAFTSKTVLRRRLAPGIVLWAYGERLSGGW